MPRADAQSTMPVMMAPDWVTNASLPGLAARCAKVALRPRPGTMITEAVGADDPQEMRPRRLEHRLLERLGRVRSALRESLR